MSAITYVKGGAICSIKRDSYDYHPKGQLVWPGRIRPLGKKQVQFLRYPFRLAASIPIP